MEIVEKSKTIFKDSFRIENTRVDTGVITETEKRLRGLADRVTITTDGYKISCLKPRGKYEIGEEVEIKVAIAEGGCGGLMNVGFQDAVMSITKAKS